MHSVNCTESTVRNSTARQGLQPVGYELAGVRITACPPVEVACHSPLPARAAASATGRTLQFAAMWHAVVPL
jgi:hypothetical protein